MKNLLQRISLGGLLGATILSIAGLQANPAQADDAQLRKAYQREFAFLEAERSSLQSRIEKLKQSNSSKIDAGQEEIDRLQGKILGLASESERISEQLYEAERTADTAGDGAEQVDSTIAQMGAALEKGGLELPEAGDGQSEALQQQLSFGFDKGLELLRRYSAVRKEKGSFFAESGKQIDGELVHIGRIATYGVSDEASGALAPAGDKRLKLWTASPSDASAQGVANGNNPDQLKIFLYESLDKGVEEKKEKTALEVVDDGGVIGWVIVWAGVVVLLMALLRSFFLMRSAANTDKLVEQIAPLVRAHQFQEAIGACDRAKSAAGRVLKATLKHINRPREELEDIISESILHETPHLDRFGSTIMVVAAVAPLLGLLGTVTGMIATFDIITEFGTGNPKLLSSGISVALVTTELGLIVAIPALLLGNLLSAWAEKIKDEMDRAALHITNISTGARFSRVPNPNHYASGPDQEKIASAPVPSFTHDQEG
ncbi:MAG: MotA/TolQ/ExbB proton channel family protein [Polyangiaceae bacterium]|nr:MotA/TolQ/ExbB proton channel family protein [Polyangiaceae bacterium]